MAGFEKEYSILAKIPEKIMHQLESLGKLIINFGMDESVQCILTKIKERSISENENKRVCSFRRSLDEIRSNYAKNITSLIGKLDESGTPGPNSVRSSSSQGSSKSFSKGETIGNDTGKNGREPKAILGAKNKAREQKKDSIFVNGSFGFERQESEDGARELEEELPKDTKNYFSFQNDDPETKPDVLATQKPNRPFNFQEEEARAAEKQKMENDFRSREGLFSPKENEFSVVAKYDYNPLKVFLTK